MSDNDNSLVIKDGEVESEDVETNNSLSVTSHVHGVASIVGNRFGNGLLRYDNK